MTGKKRSPAADSEDKERKKTKRGKVQASC